MKIRKVFTIIIIYIFFLLVFNAFSQINTDSQNANQLNHKIAILEERVNGLNTLIFWSISIFTVILIIIDVYVIRKSEKEIKNLKNDFYSWFDKVKDEIKKREKETAKNEDQIIHLKVSLIKYENLFKETIERLTKIKIEKNKISEEDKKELSSIMSDTAEIRKKRFNMYKKLLEESMLIPNQKYNIYTAVWGIATNFNSDMKEEAKELLKETQQKYEGKDQKIVHEILYAIRSIDKLDRIKPSSDYVIKKID